MLETLVENETPVLTQPRVAIVGFAEGHYNETPFEDEGWEYWGINRLHVSLPDKPWTRWFNIHDLERFHGEDKEHLDFLRQFPGPVYLRPQDIGKFDIPNQTPFPYSFLVARFAPYFNNTISWLLAYAITAEPQEIGLYGVDMAQDALVNAEYGNQRPSCEFFIGYAVGKGIGVTIPKGSDLLKTTHLYGFEDAEHLTSKYLTRLQELGSRKEKVKAEKNQLLAQIQQMDAAINQLDGAMQDNQYWLRNWRPQDIEISPNGHKED